MGFQGKVAVLFGVAALLVVGTSAEVLFSIDGPVDPIKGKAVGTTKVVDEMHFEFDIDLHSVPSSGWYNIFRVSADDCNPCLWIHDTADNDGGTYEGWFLNFGGNNHDTSLGDEPLVAGTSYHFEMEWTQSHIVVQINGNTVWNGAAEAHSTSDAETIYMSHSSWDAADVTITNFVISTDLNCWASTSGNGCESYEVCGDDNECGRNCDAFQIDDYLLECSAEFEGNENEIAGLQSDISGINTKIDNIEDDLSTKDTEISAIETALDGKADSSTTDASIQTIETALDGKADSSTTDALEVSIQELQDSIADIELHLHQISGYSAQSVPGMVDGTTPLDTDSMKWTLTAKDMTIIALLMVNLVIMATLFVVCRTGSGGKYVFEQ